MQIASVPAASIPVGSIIAGFASSDRPKSTPIHTSRRHGAANSGPRSAFMIAMAAQIPAA